MSLRDFLELFDTQMPVTIYYDCDSYGPYKIREVPDRWLREKVSQVFIEEGYDTIEIDVT